MKKLISFMAAALIAAPSASQAQTAETVSQAAGIVKKMLLPDLAKAAAKKAAEGSVWRPGKSAVYEYASGNWNKQYDHAFTYNAAGYVLTDEATATDGSCTITTNTYDSYLPSYATSTTESTRTNASSAWGEPREIMRRETTHDSEGRITRVVAYNWDDDEEALEEAGTMTLKYDSEGKASEIKMSQFSSDAGNINITVSNIKWYEYDYSTLFSILDSDGDDFGLTGNDAGKITSADITLTASNLSMNGTISGTYSDSSYQQTLSIKYMGYTVTSMQYDMAYTDANGSCVSTTVTKSQEGTSYERQTITCNNQGDCTATITKQGSSADDLSTLEGYTFDYTYADGHIAEVLTSEWAADDEPYSPLSKTVYSDYADVAAGINAATASPANAATTVYSIGGSRVGTTTDNMGKGIYIVRQGASAKKVVVK